LQESSTYFAFFRHHFIFCLFPLSRHQLKIVGLPIAGRGFMSRKLYNKNWLEQLFLHIVFGLAYLLPIARFKLNKLSSQKEQQ